MGLHKKTVHTIFVRFLETAHFLQMNWIDVSYLLQSYTVVNQLDKIKVSTISKFQNEWRMTIFIFIYQTSPCFPCRSCPGHLDNYDYFLYSYLRIGVHFVNKPSKISFGLPPFYKEVEISSNSSNTLFLSKQYTVHVFSFISIAFISILRLRFPKN